MKEEIIERLCNDFLTESCERSLLGSYRGLSLAEVMTITIREKPSGRAAQIFYSLPEHLQKTIEEYLKDNIGLISLEEFYCNPN